MEPFDAVKFFRYTTNASPWANELEYNDMMFSGVRDVSTIPYRFEKLFNWNSSGAILPALFGLVTTPIPPPPPPPPMIASVFKPFNLLNELKSSIAKSTEKRRLSNERALVESKRIESERVEKARLEAKRIESERVEKARLEAKRVEENRLKSIDDANDNELYDKWFDYEPVEEYNDDDNSEADHGAKSIIGAQPVKEEDPLVSRWIDDAEERRLQRWVDEVDVAVDHKEKMREKMKEKLESDEEDDILFRKDEGIEKAHKKAHSSTRSADAAQQRLVERETIRGSLGRMFRSMLRANNKTTKKCKRKQRMH